MDPGSAQSAKKASPTDAQFLLMVIWDEWQSVFRTTLGQSERTYVSELRDVRNRWAHQDAFSGDDAYRSLDSVHRLLLAVSAADEAVEVDRMRQDLLRPASPSRPAPLSAGWPWLRWRGGPPAA